MVSLLFSGFLFLYFLFFFYLKRDSPFTSENLLIALIFLAIVLYFASKSRGLVQQSITTIKRSKRFNGSNRNPKPVPWFIGDPSPLLNKLVNENRAMRESVQLFSNGDFYEGEFHKGRCNGSGVYNYFPDGRYEGEWIEGRYEGHGVESWTRGSRYRGQYRQGLRHGYGVYRLYTGDAYAGVWCKGQSHGVGVHSCSNGSSYVGEYKYGVKHGLGCYHFRNGDRYAGEYFGNAIHGFGVYYFANGHCYEGSWHEGCKQGYGMYTFLNGSIRCGEWDDGNLKTPLPLSNDATLRAVTAARKAAEKATRVHRVDEEVNIAVVVANRAATAARVAAAKAVQNGIDGKTCHTNV